MGADTPQLATFDPGALAEQRRASDGREQKARSGPPAPPELPPLPSPAIDEVRPRGEVGARAELSVRFNRPMVPLGDSEWMSAEQAGLRIEPAVAGKARWIEPTRLEFVPEGELPPARTFEVHFEAELEAVDGPRQRFVRDWRFTTAGPGVYLWVDDDAVAGDYDRYHWRAPVLASTTQPVRLSTFRKHLRAESVDAEGRRRSIPVKVRALPADLEGWQEADFEIRPASRWPTEGEVVIHVDGELVGTLGPRPMGYDERLSFVADGHVRVIELECDGGDYDDGCELGPVSLYLSSPISRGQARKVRIRPAVRGGGGKAIMQRYDWDADGPARALNAHDGILVWGDFEVGKTYAIEIDALTDIHGQTLAEPVRREVHFVEPPPALELSADAGTLATAATTQIGVESRHVETLEARVAAVEGPRAVEAFLAWKSQRGHPKRDQVIRDAMAGVQPVNRTVQHSGSHGWSSQTLDLQAESGRKAGLIAYEVHATALLPRARGRRVPPPLHGLVQLTDLGVSAAGSLPRGVVRVASLTTNAPVVGAEVELLDGEGVVASLGKTDAEGLIEIPSASMPSFNQVLRVRHGDDRLLVSAEALGWFPRGEARGALRSGESLRVALMTERALYRPGESVRAMGWAAIASPYTLASLRPLPEDTEIEVELRDFRGELVDRVRVHAKAHGKFWATLEVPDTAGLGDYRVEAQIVDHGLKAAGATVQVKDFRAPAFQVEASSARADLRHGEATELALRAHYYFGGPVPMRRVRTRTQCRVTDYRPPGLEPGWSVGPAPSRGHPRKSEDLAPVELPAPSLEGRVDYSLRPEASNPELPTQCIHSVAVADASETEVGAEVALMLHPALYVGVKHPRKVEAGEDLEVQLRSLDFDGEGAPGAAVEVGLTRVWGEPIYDTVGGVRRYLGHERRSQILDPCAVSTDAQGGGSCTFAALEPGRYEVRVDSGERSRPFVESELWVPEPALPDSGARFPSAPVERLTLELSAHEAQVGEHVRVQLRAPWAHGQALLLLVKGGVHSVHPVEFDQGRASVDFEVSEAWAPEVSFMALAVAPGDLGAAPPRLPELQTQRVDLVVGVASRQLRVEVEAPQTVQPRETVAIEVRARDYRGRPAAGHVSVWAVDEAVHALSPPRIPDLVGTLAVGFGHIPNVVSSYAELLTPYAAHGDPYTPWAFDPNWRAGGEGILGIPGGVPGGVMGALAGSSEAMAMEEGEWRWQPGGELEQAPMPTARSEFSSAPIFVGDAELGADGVARVEGTLPDNLTTFRLTAVASSPLTEPGSDARVEPRFGLGDARVRVTRPLVARAALPRVLRPGDSAELGVLVDNLGGGAGQLEVEVALVDAAGRALRGASALEILGSTRTKLAMDAGAQIRLPIQVRARETGAVHFEVRARLRPSAAGREAVSDVLRLPVPVEAERTLSDRVAVYGELGSAVGGEGRGRKSPGSVAALLPFTLPANIDPAFGGLSVSVSSTILGGVEDAVAYLVDYPHGCAEQTASSLAPLVPLGQLAEQGYPLGIDDTSRYVRAGVQRLRSMQVSSGGFAYWPGGLEASPHATAYATWVLTQAERAGYPVPSDMLAGATAYLRWRLDTWASQAGPSVEADVEAAWIAWTLAMVSDRALVGAAVDGLHERRGRLPVFAQAMVALAMDADDPRGDALLVELAAGIDEREGFAKIELDSRWTWYWDSEVRTSALVLLVYLDRDPDHPVVPKLTRGLLESRRGGRWSNTQENAFALFALARYAALYEAEEPNFEGRVWLDNLPVVTIAMTGRSFGFEDGFTPMAELLAASSRGAPASRSSARTSAEPLILERAGTGRMYYRVGLEWASTDPDLPAKAAGVTLRRTLRDATGVLGDDPSVASGTLLAMDVELELGSALDHLVAELPLPAGLEAVDVELGRGRAAMRIEGERGPWVSHQELRRDRAVVYADHLEPGIHHTTVFLRATTPGDYTMPAATAELMYYPEIHARTTGQRLRVR
ncbi:hypothetical protein PPSIR1_08621 [Plesiocystis pacifica SIR-1]|uniref:Alpha-2-macroglobulin-like protein n=1 Tax=Plesiocystis pacifica SIR-1 TaxID=391625 RepID=A6G7A1_9BACT|nr:hypothetical protein PPSIR1_08621 [Plesiocystis pacifica SIR-1]